MNTEQTIALLEEFEEELEFMTNAMVRFKGRVQEAIHQLREDEDITDITDL